MSAWPPHQLTFELYTNRQWRLGGYVPFTTKITLSDIASLEQELLDTFPTTYWEKDYQPHYATLLFDRLSSLEARRS